MIRKCADFAARFRTFNDPEDLRDQLEIILKSEASCILLLYCVNNKADELQETLVGFLGFDDMDFIQDLLTHRTELVQPTTIRKVTIGHGRYSLYRFQ